MAWGPGYGGAPAPNPAVGGPDPFTAAESDTKSMVSADWWPAAPPQQRAQAIAGRVLALPDGTWWVFGAWARWYRWHPSDQQWYLCPPPQSPATRQSARPVQPGLGMPELPPHVVPAGPDFKYEAPAALPFAGKEFSTDLTARVRATLDAAAALNPADYPHWWALFSSSVPSTVAVAWGVMLWCAAAPVYDSRYDDQMLALWTPYRAKPLPVVDGPRWLTPPPLEALVGLYAERLRAGRVDAAVVVLRTMWAVAGALREDMRFRARAEALIAVVGSTLSNPQMDYGALPYGDQALVQQWVTRVPAELAPAIRVESSPGDHFRHAYYDLAVAVTRCCGDPSEPSYLEPRLVAAALLAADLATVKQDTVEKVVPWLDPEIRYTIQAVLSQRGHPLRRLWPSDDRMPEQLRRHMEGRSAKLLAAVYSVDLSWCRLAGIPARPRGFPVPTAIIGEMIGLDRARAAASAKPITQPPGVGTPAAPAPGWSPPDSPPNPTPGTAYGAPPGGPGADQPAGAAGYAPPAGGYGADPGAGQPGAGAYGAGAGQPGAGAYGAPAGGYGAGAPGPGGYGDAGAGQPGAGAYGAPAGGYGAGAPGPGGYGGDAGAGQPGAGAYGGPAGGYGAGAPGPGGYGGDAGAGQPGADGYGAPGGYGVGAPGPGGYGDAGAGQPGAGGYGGDAYGAGQPGGAAGYGAGAPDQAGGGGYGVAAGLGGAAYGAGGFGQPGGAYGQGGQDAGGPGGPYGAGADQGAGGYGQAAFGQQGLPDRGGADAGQADQGGGAYGQAAFGQQGLPGEDAGHGDAGAGGPGGLDLPGGLPPLRSPVASPAEAPQWGALPGPAEESDEAGRAPVPLHGAHPELQAPPQEQGDNWLPPYTVLGFEANEVTPQGGKVGADLQAQPFGQDETDDPYQPPVPGPQPDEVEWAPQYTMLGFERGGGLPAPAAPAQQAGAGEPIDPMATRMDGSGLGAASPTPSGPPRTRVLGADDVEAAFAQGPADSGSGTGGPADGGAGSGQGAWAGPAGAGGSGDAGAGYGQGAGGSGPGGAGGSGDAGVGHGQGGQAGVGQGGWGGAGQGAGGSGPGGPGDAGAGYGQGGQADVGQGGWGGAGAGGPGDAGVGFGQGGPGGGGAGPGGVGEPPGTRVMSGTMVGNFLDAPLGRPVGQVAPPADASGLPVTERFGIRFVGDGGPEGDLSALLRELAAGAAAWGQGVVEPAAERPPSAPSVLLVGEAHSGQRRLARIVARAMQDAGVGDGAVRIGTADDVRGAPPEGLQVVFNPGPGPTLLFERLDAVLSEAADPAAAGAAIKAARFDRPARMVLLATCTPRALRRMQADFPELVRDFRVFQMPDLSEPAGRLTLVHVLAVERRAVIDAGVLETVRHDLTRLRGPGDLVNGRLVETYLDRACQRGIGRMGGPVQQLLLTAPDFGGVAESIEPALRPAGDVDGYLRRVDEMIGVPQVKAAVHRLADAARGGDGRARNVALAGRAGSGKKTVAGLIGGIYAALGLLDAGHVVACRPVHLAGRDQADTENRVHSMVEQAMGGVLLLTEADRLERYPAVVEELRNYLTERAGRFILICTSEDDGFEAYLLNNPDFRAVFAEIVRFVELSDRELVQLFQWHAEKSLYALDEELRLELMARFGRMREEEEFAFGRTVREMFEQTVSRQAARLGGVNSDAETITRLTAQDLPETALQQAFRDFHRQ